MKIKNIDKQRRYETWIFLFKSYISSTSSVRKSWGDVAVHAKADVLASGDTILVVRGSHSQGTSCYVNLGLQQWDVSYRIYKSNTLRSYW